ncbi:hypothetical protein ACHHYP_13085 [Achlya hypogyna]|uniref:SAM domain-containing protein n=1 Tax=Achlya hypogyna TaxID=1202772 RepID=A0A1V9YG17_ACHHY|nr:hypothetical protein ACHHYP_13085 [Achlya hypogyna]
MGTAGSRSLQHGAPAPKLSAAELGDFVTGLGPEFAPYGEQIVAQGIDSVQMLTLAEADLIAACRVTNAAHVATMLYHLKRLKPPPEPPRKGPKPKRRSIGREEAATAAAEAARADVQQAVLASIESTSQLTAPSAEETVVTPMDRVESISGVAKIELPPIEHPPQVPVEAFGEVTNDSATESRCPPIEHTVDDTKTAVAAIQQTVVSDVDNLKCLQKMSQAYTVGRARDVHPNPKPQMPIQALCREESPPVKFAGLRPVMSIHTMVRDHFDEIVTAPVATLNPTLSHYHAYFSYAVGKDSASRIVRERIALIHKNLVANGIVVWYDADKSVTENALIQQGLAHSSVIIVFVTRHYMNLVNSDGQLESCQYEFSLALHMKTVERMIFIVLEDEMKRYDCLSGEFRIIIGDQECMDFTHDEYYDDACLELAEKVLELEHRPPPPQEPGLIEAMGVGPLMNRLKQDHQPWEATERVLKRLIVLAMASPAYSDKMLTKGILPIMVHFVKLDFSDEGTGRVEVPPEAELALLLLKILARSSGVLRRKILLAIQDMSLLTSFTAYLTVGEGFTKEHMAGLIRNLFVVGGIKAFDKSDGFKQTIAALLKILGTGTMLQQYEAGAALCAISLNREYQSLLVEESAIPICMRKLTTTTSHETVRDKAALVLRYLSGTEDNQREIGSEGGIVAFLTLLKSGTHSQRDTSAAALNWLMECSENRSRLVKENGILTLLNYVVRGRKFVRQQTLSALSKLAPHAEYQIPLAKAGLLGPCVAILGVGNDSQKTAACIVLTALASTDLLEKMKDAIGPVVNLYCEGTVPQKKAAKIVLEKLSRNKLFKEQIVALVKEESLMLH